MEYGNLIEYNPLKYAVPMEYCIILKSRLIL